MPNLTLFASKVSDVANTGLVVWHMNTVIHVITSAYKEEICKEYLLIR